MVRRESRRVRASDQAAASRAVDAILRDYVRSPEAEPMAANAEPAVQVARPPALQLTGHGPSAPRFTGSSSVSLAVVTVIAVALAVLFVLYAR